jgi:hypothetical protein
MSSSQMPSDNMNVLRALGAAADLPSFLHLFNSIACETVFCSIEDSNDFARQQRHGYTALVLAALSRGLQLYNTAHDIAAATAGQGHNPPAAPLLQDLAQMVDKLCFLAITVLANSKRCLLLWGEGSQEAKNMEQEFLDFGLRCTC